MNEKVRKLCFLSHFKGGGWGLEGVIVDGRYPDVESLPEQRWTDKSKGSCTLTGWIETPGILSALLNFRKMKVGKRDSSTIK